MLKLLRIKLVQIIIDLNEKLVFDKRLKRFYNKFFYSGQINSVIDVGSNKGQTIDFFLKMNPNCKIYGFEPNPTLFKKLKKKYSTIKNIKLYQLGISDQNGKKEFHENVFDTTSTFEDLNLNSEYLKKKSSILGVRPNEIVKSSYNVDITTLSNFIDKNINEDIDIIKIDTEGHEYSCLLGLFNKTLNINIKLLQLENHNDDMYINKVSFEKIVALLNESGYKLIAKIKHGFGDIEEVIFEMSTDHK